jgi:hypothetical protein
VKKVKVTLIRTQELAFEDEWDDELVEELMAMNHTQRADNLFEICLDDWYEADVNEDYANIKVVEDE